MGVKNCPNQSKSELTHEGRETAWLSKPSTTITPGHNPPKCDSQAEPLPFYQSHHSKATLAFLPKARPTGRLVNGRFWGCSISHRPLHLFLTGLYPRISPLTYVTRYWCELSQAQGAAAATDAQSFLTNVGWKAYQSPYSVIVGCLSYEMDHRDGEAKGLVATGLERLKNDWSYPCVQFLGGQITAEQLLTQAGTDNQKLTEAHTYIGLKAAIDGRKDDARTHLAWVRDYGYKPYL